MSRAASRSASNSGRASAAALRLSMNPVRTKPIAVCRLASARARRAFALKSLEVDCIVSPAASGRVRLTDRRLGELAGQHRGDVTCLDRAAATLQLSRHVEQAAEIAGQQQVGTALLYRLALGRDD